MQLDIDRLVAYFGGVNALAEALKQHDPKMPQPLLPSINGAPEARCLWHNCKN